MEQNETKITINKKNKIIILIIAILFFIYVFLFLWAKKIEMISTFPWYKIDNTNLSVDKVLYWEYEEINIDDWYWNNINWIYVKSDIENAKTVYFFHGNSWPIYFFYNWINYINKLWFNVMVYDYPWYWKSDWLPYKNNVSNFSQKFYDYLKEEKNIKNEDLIVWWYSIWTAVWVDFASNNEFDKILLFAPLSSRYDASKHYLWFAAQKLFFIKDSYDTYKIVKNFKRDALIIHWNKDWIIPFWHWKKVFENYKWNKYFIEIDNQWHNNIIENNWEYLLWFIRDFLNDYDIWKEILLDDDFKSLLQDSIDENKFIDSLDMKTDSSLQKFVTSNLSFQDKSYIPENLINIKWDYIIDWKWWSQLLRKEANESLQNMSELFFNDLWEKMLVVSAYRSYNYQKWIKDRGCPDNLCAKAWYSEHQSWLAVDFWEASTKYDWDNNPKLQKYYIWLNDNAHKFGFHNTYQRWLNIDWYEIEPWHWRYLWVELATYLKNKDLTIAEFYNVINNDN